RETMENTAHKLFGQIDRELKVEIEKGNIRPISAPDLMLNIVSMNIFIFVAMPLFSSILHISEEEKPALLERRKKEITETILKSLRP
ncbi:MAG: TetR/AcrR family transcriptional regulator, partial [Dysgonamonadaceae bacterium]|nr:TetR/AcrR family transcriptional regulator [Dysgonamonadaceae bacterium]